MLTTIFKYLKQELDNQYYFIKMVMVNTEPAVGNGYRQIFGYNATYEKIEITPKKPISLTSFIIDIRLSHQELFVVGYMPYYRFVKLELADPKCLQQLLTVLKNFLNDGNLEPAWHITGASQR